MTRTTGPRLEWRRVYERVCVHCGQAFLAGQPGALYCSPSHRGIAWRAAVMLEGRYARIDGKFRRVRAA
jgi:hypothetical protein